MKLIIDARLESADPHLLRESIRLVSINRPDDDLERLGLSLEEGRELMAAAQASVGQSWIRFDLRWKMCDLKLRVRLTARRHDTHGQAQTDKIRHRRVDPAQGSAPPD